jgi:enamine deaminase RidA (YjgF/YER057c/UK114 family)
LICKNNYIFETQTSELKDIVMNKILFTAIVFFISTIIHAQTTDPEKELVTKKILLPAAGKPSANFVKHVQTGNLLFLSGHGFCGPNPSAVDTGKLGGTLTVDQGYQAARNVGLCMLATLKDAVGDLNKVKRIIRVYGMVNCTDDFKDQPKVMNGFSDLMVEVFGENGKHVRAAVGMNALPNGISVEVEMLVELKE